MGALVVLAAIAAASAASAHPGDGYGAPYDTLNVFDGNILWPNNATTQIYGGGPGSSGFCAPYTARQLATQFFANNDSIDPMLADPFNVTSPRWDPLPGSPARCQSGGSAVVDYPDPWFEKAYYIGAVPPRTFPNEDWTTGWTYYSNTGGAGRTDINYTKPLVTLVGAIATQTLTPANNYLLRGKVEVAPGHTLTIQPGTVLFGEFSTTGYLVIDRGAKIMAIGTREQPIIMTSSQAPGSMAPGDNGGWVIHGRARANCQPTPADSCVSEGGAGAYGGNNDADNSGVIRYVRIEYSGKELAPNNELNALTMNAVGAGTTIEYVQTHMGSDDGPEWFGGTVNCKHIIQTGGDDDNLDWQLGYRGFIQFLVCQQHPGRCDAGIEADNSEFGANNQPRSHPVISNVTLVGAPTGGGTATNRGTLFRRGTAFYVINSIFTGWRGPAMAIDAPANAGGPQTYHCPGPQPAVLCTPGVTAVEAEAATLPNSLRAMARPNPAMGMTDIGFRIEQAGRVRVQIFDVSGRLVETVVDQPMASGTHAVRWIPRASQSGTYYFRVTTDNGQVSTGKVTYLK
jgi:hypothetical protein